MPVSKKRKKKSAKVAEHKKITKRKSGFTDTVHKLSRNKVMIVMAYGMYALIIFGVIALIVMALQK